MVAACDVDRLKLERNKKIVEDHYAGKKGQSYKGCDTTGEFRDILARDPFSRHDVAEYEITEFFPVMTCAELEFLRDA